MGGGRERRGGGLKTRTKKGEGDGWRKAGKVRLRGDVGLGLDDKRVPGDGGTHGQAGRQAGR